MNFWYFSENFINFYNKNINFKIISDAINKIYKAYLLRILLIRMRT